MKYQSLSALLGLSVMLSGCSAVLAPETSAVEGESEEAVSVRKEDCLFGTTVSQLFATAEDKGLGIENTILHFESLTSTETTQLKAVYDLVDDVALDGFMKGKQVDVAVISEVGGPRKFELFRAATGRMRVKSGTFVIAGTSAVVATFDDFDDVKSCLVTKLGGLDLRGKACAFGESTETWTDNGTVKLGSKSTIKATTNLSAMRKAQLLGAASETDLNALLNRPYDEIHYRTVTVPGLDEKFTYLWHYPGDTEVGAIFRQGSADIVARVGDGDVEECVVAAPSAPKGTACGDKTCAVGERCGVLETYPPQYVCEKNQ